MTLTDEQLKQYQKNGYLIIENFISPHKLDQLYGNYKQLRVQLAKDASLAQADYEREISQIRDLWRFESSFNQLLLQEEVAQLAPLFFEDQSCRLLHDHVINKPLGNNGVVPWHQDYTYWPVDNPHGLSVWLPFTSLDKDAGVLEVIPESHKLGEKKPVDFMNDQHDFQEYTTLAVKKGDVVILDALTWHRTSKNTSVQKRIAYIALLIPSYATYAPKHAHWHPINDNVTVQEGEVLNEDWFPSIGRTEDHAYPISYADNTQNTEGGINMFNASKVVKKFLIHHLPQTKNLNLCHYLYNKEQRQDAVQVLRDRFDLNLDATKGLDEAMLSLAINGIAYEHHRARNVYNKSYIIFKKLFGNELQLC